jgi:radical SAM protein with 4Fe4S-binding SPASM domain
VQEVQISLYSPRAEVHDWVTGVKGSFEKTVAGARYLIEAGVAVVLKTPLMSVNTDEYDEYIRFVTALGADFSLDPHLSTREDGDRTPVSLGLRPEEYLRIRRDPRLSPRKLGKLPPQRSPDTRPCGACSGNIHIEADGEIRPCTQLAVPTGHALREGVRAAWRDNDAAQKIRELTWKDLHGCRECDLRDYCQRCFADAQREGADALGPYASACRRARLEYAVVHGHEPIIEAQPGRDPELGPYRSLEEPKFLAVADVLTHADRMLADNYPWIRPSREPNCRPVTPARPGGLVQLRRPGKRTARLERVPAPPGVNSEVQSVSAAHGRSRFKG